MTDYSKILEDDRFMTFAGVLSVEEADIKDMFHPGLYASILNAAFAPAGKG